MWPQLMAESRSRLRASAALLSMAVRLRSFVQWRREPGDSHA